MSRRLTKRQEVVSAAAGGYLLAPPIAMAHRGGIHYGPNEGNENSLLAFSNAVDLGFSYIETDVQVSADGVVYCFHDPSLARVTGRESAFGELTSAQIDQVRLLGGEPIPRLADVLAALPQVRFNIDIKTDAVLMPALAVLDDAGAYDRVMLGCFSHRRMKRLRAARPQAATSASPLESIAAVRGVAPVSRLGARHGALAMQIPTVYRGRTVLTPRSVRTAHTLNMQMHVWVIDEPDEINRLLDMGVDGIVTDRPDVLKDVLIARGAWAS